MAISTIGANGLGSGAVTNAKIDTMAATKLTGQVPDANAPSGSVIQVVNAVTTAVTDTTSSSYVATALSVTITPSSATSKVLILHNGMINILTNVKWMWYTLYRNSTNLATSGAAGGALGGIYNNSATDSHCPTSIAFLDSPSTTSAVTYTIYVKTESGARGRYNADGWYATINALEIAG